MKAYASTTKFQPFTILLANHWTAAQSNVMSLMEGSINGRNFVVPA